MNLAFAILAFLVGLVLLLGKRLANTVKSDVPRRQFIDALGQVMDKFIDVFNVNDEGERLAAVGWTLWSAVRTIDFLCCLFLLMCLEQTRLGDNEK